MCLLETMCVGDQQRQHEEGCSDKLSEFREHYRKAKLGWIMSVHGHLSGTSRGEKHVENHSAWLRESQTPRSRVKK